MSEHFLWSKDSASLHYVACTDVQRTIVEPAAAAGLSRATRALRAVKQLGVKVDMDDFGTGYSSLACLHDFPIDMFKIDRSFVSVLTENESDKALAEAIIVMAHKLGLSVNVFIQVRLEKQVERSLEIFERAIRDRPEVMECYLMTGASDYMLRVLVQDIAALERFIVEFLTRIPGVGNIQSSFALKQVKYQTALPLPQALASRAAR